MLSNLLGRTVVVLLILLASGLAAQTTELWIKALDQNGRMLEGIRFAFGGVESAATTDAGVTELAVPEMAAGEAVKLDLPRSLSEEWFLIDSTVHAPAGLKAGPAEVVLMRRAEFRELAGAARDAAGQAPRSGEEISEEEKRRILAESATQHGLTEDQLAQAIDSFGKTEDPMDRGIAAYLAGEYASAEAELLGVAEEKENDYVDTLYYLGAAQYEQGKYAKAIASFRKAVAVRPDDLVLLNWLGNALDEMAEWSEAETFKRRVVVSLQESGEDSPEIATAMCSLAQSLQEPNRLEEAERLMRQALSIDQSIYGPDHPNVARDLHNLALVLKVTNRQDEAEQLLRRALSIAESSYGPDHPKVAIHLSNLAVLLQAMSRFSEAEPLMRRALSIDESSFGPDHPQVAKSLSYLALFLQATNRSGEAEPLLRRALSIAESSFGPDNQVFAICLYNLAKLLQGTNRLGEAEPLMRQALAILEASLGMDHRYTRIVRVNLILLEAIASQPSPSEE